MFPTLEKESLREGDEIGRNPFLIRSMFSDVKKQLPGYVQPQRNCRNPFFIRSTFPTVLILFMLLLPERRNPFLIRSMFPTVDIANKRLANTYSSLSAPKTKIPSDLLILTKNMATIS